ncbi:hypothetical protein NMY22_g761 [Coprinellus aureogranulatus]|nr:hypothetical protein NMY22_g761 [Coprinellus aureogranulatus]
MTSACDGPRTKATLEVPHKDTPHSNLVGLHSPPAQTAPSPLNTADDTPFLAPSPQRPPASPPIPARSPLRPPAKSISSSGGNSARSSRRLTLSDALDTPPSSAIDDSTIIVDPQSSLGGRNSFASMNEQLLEALNASDVLSKSATARPPSSISFEAESRPKSQYSTSSSSSSAPVPPQQPMSKRQHALLELLSSERAYAADLALIKGVHMRLAQGLPAELVDFAGSPLPSSGSSSRTLSTASDSSAASLGPPMTDEDVQKIFSNILILAAISDQLCEELEVALGSLIKGGTGEDRVGALFCEKVSEPFSRPPVIIDRRPICDS